MTRRNLSIHFPAALLLFIMLFTRCGKTPSGLPGLESGSLMITAQDTVLTDTILVRLDYDDPAAYGNPCVIDDIIAGFHRLHVYTEAAAGSVFSNVEIADQDTTRIEFTLNSGPVPGAFVGNIAHDFLVQDLNGQPVQLSALQGRVVMLLFIEYT